MKDFESDFHLTKTHLHVRQTEMGWVREFVEN